MPTETIFYLKCFLKRRISIVSNLFGSSIHNCTDCSLGNTCQSRSHALATYSNFQNYRIHIGAVRRQIPQLCACGVICVVCPRRSAAAFYPALCSILPIFSSPCDILYHFLLQLSRVTAILKVAIIKISVNCCN